MMSKVAVAGLVGVSAFGAHCPGGCTVDQYCSPNEAMCVARKAPGSYCNTVQECVNTATCEDNVCVTTGAALLRPGCGSTIASKVTTNKWAGGTLYVTDASSPTEWTAVVDLADAAIAAGCVPKHKPHMVMPSPNGLYAAISYTGDKFIHILDTATKEIVMCIDASAPAAGVVGGAMHTMSWYSDEQVLLCDMTGSVNGVAGGAIHKFTDLDFAAGTYSYAASVAIGSTKVGRGTTATKPIALGNNPLGEFKDFFFVTDAKGAGSIINAADMTVAADITNDQMSPCTAGGLWVEPHPEDPKIVVVQYGTQDVDTTTPECLYKVDMEKLQVVQTINLPVGADDAHGIQFCKNSDESANFNDDYFLLNTNRASATLDVLSYTTGVAVIPEFDLNAAFDIPALQPDVAFFKNNMLFMGARGPEPVSAVKPQNFNADATPGVFFLGLTDCINPTYGEQHSLLTELDRSIITSDVHGIWGVNDEIWVVDQAATGSVETFDVFSKCPVEV